MLDFANYNVQVYKSPHLQNQFFFITSLKNRFVQSINNRGTKCCKNLPGTGSNGTSGSTLQSLQEAAVVAPFRAALPGWQTYLGHAQAACTDGHLDVEKPQLSSAGGCVCLGGRGGVCGPEIVLLELKKKKKSYCQDGTQRPAGDAEKRTNNSF